MNPAAHQPPQEYVTIAEFCARFGISKAFYFKMRDAGNGPDELRMGARKVVITNEALAAWEKKRTRSSAA
jgi:predicted DNA-binding transcriptional regulator AlpA